MNKPLVTVAVLTYNGERYLDQIFSALRQQLCEFSFETLVIDSGSTDSTLGIIARYPEVRLHQIPNSEFGHGKTRNLAAQLARGKYIAYLTHDAIPANNQWLANIIAPMEAQSAVMGVLGRQLPRTNCVPMLKYEIQLTFARQGAHFGMTFLNQQDVEYASVFDRSAMTFYSDVNSATRVDFLRDGIPYRDVDYAEDQMFAEDLLASGYWKAYAPQASVIHSNDLSLKEIGPRTFDEVFALRKLGHDLKPLPVPKTIGVVLKKSLGDSGRLFKDPEISGLRLLYWLFWNPLFIANKWNYYNKACRVSFSDSDTIGRHSLETSKKMSAN